MKVKIIIYITILMVIIPTVVLASYNEHPLRMLISMYGKYDSCAKHTYNYGNGVKTTIKEYLWKEKQVYLMISKSPSMWKGWRVVSYFNLEENKEVVKPNA
jgi:hypothetical protein